MKTTYHVPTEQFGFIEVEAEQDDIISFQEITSRIEAYRAISEAVKAPTDIPTGLTDKEMDFIIEKMMLGVGVENGTELYHKATEVQKTEIQRLKRALKRIKNRNGEEEID